MRASRVKRHTRAAACERRYPQTSGGICTVCEICRVFIWVLVWVPVWLSWCFGAPVYSLVNSGQLSASAASTSPIVVAPIFYQLSEFNQPHSISIHSRTAEL